MKGNYDTNYCDRVAEGETRNCQELAAQENYKKKMADNAAIPLYQKYYKRYAARVRVRQIKEYDFKKWKYQAMTKRDECTDGKITLTEFEAWLEASFPNRKRKIEEKIALTSETFSYLAVSTSIALNINCILSIFFIVGNVYSTNIGNINRYTTN